MEVLISLTKVIISQCICTSNHHVAHLRSLTFLLVNYTSGKLGKPALRLRDRRWQLEGRQEGAVGRLGTASAWCPSAVAEPKRCSVAQRGTDLGFPPGSTTSFVTWDKLFSFSGPQFPLRYNGGGRGSTRRAESVALGPDKASAPSHHFPSLPVTSR